MVEGKGRDDKGAKGLERGTKVDERSQKENQETKKLWWGKTGTIEKRMEEARGELEKEKEGDEAVQRLEMRVKEIGRGREVGREKERERFD